LPEAIRGLRKKSSRPYCGSWARDDLAASRELEKGLVTRPADWIDCVNEALSTDELERLHVSVNRGRPKKKTGKKGG
jgi:hypothetical protein